MLKVLRSLSFNPGCCVRYFGLKRPKAKASVKEFLKMRDKQPVIEGNNFDKEGEAKDIHRREELTAKINAMADRILPTYGWIDLRKHPNSFSMLDHAMHRQFNTEKLPEDVRPIRGTKHTYVNFVPTLRTLAIYGNLNEHYDEFKGSELIIRSDFDEREKVPISIDTPMNFTQCHMQFFHHNDIDGLRKLIPLITALVEANAQGGLPKQEKKEDHYPPTLFSYFDTLPLWARKNQGVRNVFMGLEYYKPGIDIWKKEQGLSMALKKFAHITDIDRLMAQAVYDRTPTQLSKEKVLDMVLEYGMYPAGDDELVDDNEDEIIAEMFPEEEIKSDDFKTEEETGEEDDEGTDEFLENLDDDLENPTKGTAKEDELEAKSIKPVSEPQDISKTEVEQEALGQEEVKKKKRILPPLKKLNEVEVTDDEFYHNEPDPNEVPHDIGELDCEPTIMQLLTDSPKDTEERASLEKYESIPFFARTPIAGIPTINKRPLRYKYNWFPVILSL